MTVFPAPTLLLATLLAMFASGCAVGPEYHRPALAQATSYVAEPIEATMRTQREVVVQDLPAQWWTLYRSEPLNRLVRAALKNNPSVESAAAALRQAMELRLAQQAAYFPTVGASYSASRQRVASSLSSPLASNANVFNLSTAQLSVSYTPDLFGANRRQVESLRALEQAQRWSVEATYLTLSSNVVVAAITEAGLRAQIEATERELAMQADILDRYQRLHRLGESSQLDVAQQEAQLAALQVTLPSLQRQLDQQRDLIKALAGVLPGAPDIPEFRLEGLTLINPLPLTLPSTLVEHRPDILAAEEQLRSASAQIGVAVANRLPQITLGENNWGSTVASLSGLFGPGTMFWTLAGSATQTVFDGGALRHKEAAARAAYDQAAAIYRSTVVNAFQNVADALHAVHGDAQSEQASQRSLELADRTLAITRRQLELGDASAIAVIQSEQARQQAMINTIEARAQRLSDAAALFQALGGGWWNRVSAESVSAARAVDN